MYLFNVFLSFFCLHCSRCTIVFLHLWRGFITFKKRKLQKKKYIYILKGAKPKNLRVAKRRRDSIQRLTRVNRKAGKKTPLFKVKVKSLRVFFGDVARLQLGFQFPGAACSRLRDLAVTHADWLSEGRTVEAELFPPLCVVGLCVLNLN